MSGGAEIQVVVFDLDGVLMESTPWHAQAYSEVLAEAGVPDFSYARFAGMRTRDVMGIIGAERGTGWGAERLSELSAAKTRRALELIRANRPLVPGCEELVRELAGRYRVGLASSASRESVNWFLEATGLGSVFGVVLTGRDVAEAKPSPEIYLRAIEALGGGKPLVVEDAAAGVSAGRAAGARVWGVLTSSSEEQLLAAGAERCFGDLASLGRVLLA